MKQQPKIHDSFFRSAIANPRLARAFLEQHLPSELLAGADLSRVKLEKEHFVDERLRSRVVDVLFSMPMGYVLGYVYVLVEHQSTVDPLMAFRLRQYVYAVMDYHLKKSGKSRLPLIYPMVFYNGNEPYWAKRDLWELVAGPEELKRLCLDGPVKVIDLGQMPDQRLKGHVWLAIMQLLMKHIHRPTIAESLIDLIPYLMQIEKENNGAEFLVRALRYVMEGADYPEVKPAFDQVFGALTEKNKERVMTIAEELERKGFKRGKEQGREQGFERGLEHKTREVCKRLASQGFKVEQIAELLQMELPEVKQMIEN